MKQKSDCICRKIIDKPAKNWKRISFNDFGVRYSNTFIDEKQKEKMLWKNLFSQKSIINLKEE